MFVDVSKLMFGKRLFKGTLTQKNRMRPERPSQERPSLERPDLEKCDGARKASYKPPVCGPPLFANFLYFISSYTVHCSKSGLKINLRP
jgi:hypothetical protein